MTHDWSTHLSASQAVGHIEYRLSGAKRPAHLFRDEAGSDIDQILAHMRDRLGSAFRRHPLVVKAILWK